MTLKSDWANGDSVTPDALNAISSRVNSLDRRNVKFIDDFGADPTGATESNQPLIDAYNALNGDPGVIVFGVGTYLLYVGLNEAAGRLIKPRQAVVGQGSGLTTIDYRGSGAFVETRNKTFATTGNAPAGGVHGMTILGWNNANTNACGVRYGDIWRMRTSDLEISGFLAAGGKGIWGDNQVYWSERAHIECVVNQCAECFVFESNTGDQGFPTGSFDYSQYELSFVAQPNQHGFVLRSGTPGSRVSMNGASVTLTGNCQLAPAGSTNDGVMFRVGKDNADEASFSGTLNIGVETSGSAGGVAHYDFAQGDGPFYLVNSKVTATGSINLIPFSGSYFQAGSATPRTFAFGGLLKGSSALGGTSSVQAFQSLQLVSQPRGGTYLADTNCIQTIYVTQATGGTFTLSYAGHTTSALPYDASVSAVLAALEALPSIGVGNILVRRAQARFVDSYPKDELGWRVQFVNSLGASSLPSITVNPSLTGAGATADVEMTVPGSTHKTWVLYIQDGGIFTLEPSPGTYRLRVEIGGLTQYGSPLLDGDCPFGVNGVDVWIRQPDAGGPAIFEGPYLVPTFGAGSTHKFQWFDGQDPILSTTPGAVDVVRLSSYNFSVWKGQHLTKNLVVAVPSSASAPGITGQVAYDASYRYDCVATNTWKRSAVSSW